MRHVCDHLLQEASSLQSAERDHVTKQPGAPPTEVYVQCCVLVYWLYDLFLGIHTLFYTCTE